MIVSREFYEIILAARKKKLKGEAFFNVTVALDSNI
jgi:hypothetical protein